MKGLSHTYTCIHSLPMEECVSILELKPSPPMFSGLSLEVYITMDGIWVGTSDLRQNFSLTLAVQTDMLVVLS